MDRVRAAETGAGSAALADGLALRAGALIVTLYGDVVEPRGGEAWIGNVIATCSDLGLSETLVRTAVSRLVAAGHLEGRRRGRRSFYRLTAAAQAEYAQAAQVIFAPPEPCGWRFVWCADDGGAATLERAGMARVGPGLLAGPDRGPLPPDAAVFRAESAGAKAALRAFVARNWDLAALAGAYVRFIERFSPLAAPRDGVAALRARLLLVHVFRQSVLQDPRLPPDALPRDWPGHAARAVFARLYAQLSQGADAHVGAVFLSAEGGLAAQTGATRARLALLARNGAAGRVT